MRASIRYVALLLTGLLVAALGVTTAAAPAEAAVTTLCTGYSACSKAGMSARGYAAANDTMYWRMYAGHNCTNYAAYRMVQSGLPNVRPWSGGGNATNWGTAMSAITDGTPAVGAVAWWKAYAYPAGSAGHVAYVERVVSADEIIVSQDSWGGDFSWARITRSGKGWPTGFVHFNDVPLQNTAPPAVDGTAKVGSALTASPGAWNPGSVTVSYRWRANGVRIAGATARTFTPGPAEEGKQITVRVVASQLGYPTTAALSAATPVVLPGEIRNTAAPTVTGDPRVDQTLTVGRDSWYPAPDRVSYQWSADGVPIPGATATTLPVDPSLVGKALTVTATAEKTGYQPVPVVSAATAPVRPGILTVTAPPTLSGTPRPGETLTLTLPRVAPEASAEVQWLRGGVPVAGATGPTYRLTADDLGARIAARVRLTRPGYTTVTTRAPGTPRVRTVPRLRVTKVVRHSRVLLRVRATAPGVSPVPGVIQVRARGHLLAEVPLRHGVARVRLTGLRAGRWTFHLRLPMTDAVAPATTTRTARVR